MSIARDHIRLRCEQETKNSLLRLRSFYISNSVQPDRLATALRNAMDSFLGNLAVLWTLKTNQDPPNDEKEMLEQAARQFDFELDSLTGIFAFRNGGEQPEPSALKALYCAFMKNVERLAHLADQLDL